MKAANGDVDALRRETVWEIVMEHIKQEDHEISVTSYEESSDFMEDSFRIAGYDIYIMDIPMPRINGIALGLHLRQIGFGSKILYLTSSTDYSIAAFKAKASDYHRGGISYNRQGSHRHIALKWV